MRGLALGRRLMLVRLARPCAHSGEACSRRPSRLQIGHPQHRSAGRSALTQPSQAQ